MNNPFEKWANSEQLYALYNPDEQTNSYKDKIYQTSHKRRNIQSE